MEIDKLELLQIPEEDMLDIQLINCSNEDSSQLG